ncbi:MAG: hypothetical protein C0483_24340 [Pirellula sp.]|nr:hypothetical protein [Pirellula sp.]
MISRAASISWQPELTSNILKQLETAAHEVVEPIEGLTSDALRRQIEGRDEKERCKPKRLT